MEKKEERRIGKKEDQGKTAGKLMVQIIKDLNAEVTRTEEPTKIEGNQRNSISFQNK